jgi:hypothetical protein
MSILTTRTNDAAMAKVISDKVYNNKPLNDTNRQFIERIRKQYEIGCCARATSYIFANLASFFGLCSDDCRNYFLESRAQAIADGALSHELKSVSRFLE